MAAQAVVKREEHAVSACPDAQEVVRKKVTACIFHDPVSLGRSAGCACRGTAILADRTSCGKVRVLGMSCGRYGEALSSAVIDAACSCAAFRFLRYGYSVERLLFQDIRGRPCNHGVFGVLVQRREP